MPEISSICSDVSAGCSAVGTGEGVLIEGSCFGDDPEVYFDTAEGTRIPVEYQPDLSSDRLVYARTAQLAAGFYYVVVKKRLRESKPFPYTHRYNCRLRNDHDLCASGVVTAIETSTGSLSGLYELEYTIDPDPEGGVTTLLYVSEDPSWTRFCNGASDQSTTVAEVEVGDHIRGYGTYFGAAHIECEGRFVLTEE